MTLITGYFILTCLLTAHHASMEIGVPGPGPVKYVLLLIVRVDTTIRKSVRGQIIMENVKKKQKKDIPVSDFCLSVLSSYHNSGDPTLKQKAKILIVELDLHKSSTVPAKSSLSNDNTGTPEKVSESTKVALISVSKRRVRTSAPFCPKPVGEKICNTKKSKFLHWCI